MKNFVALFALVLTVSVFAFSISDYKAGYATVPAFFQGTLAVSTAWDGEDGVCKAIKTKASIPAYMAICQPCLNCWYNCMVVDGSDYDTAYTPVESTATPAVLSGYLYYIVSVDKKLKEVEYFTVDITNTTLFNYGYSKNDKQVAFWQNTLVNDEPMFAATGDKDHKVWTKGLSTSVVKSIDGLVFFPQADAGNGSIAAWTLGSISPEGMFFNGTLKLKRNDSVTKKLFAAVLEGISDECWSTDVICEDIIGSAIDVYVFGKTYKNYDVTEVYDFF